MESRGNLTRSHEISHRYTWVLPSLHIPVKALSTDTNRMDSQHPESEKLPDNGRYKELQRATKSYKELQRATKSYKELQRATKSYKELQRATKSYKELQRATKSYKKLLRAIKLLKSY
ncbi:hypothetical protein BSK56_09950 [Paenibacillus borealis]|uniref:Uncharacterized protein n=1 Tax=Paenibacillus borealis TaxID=160799 RepID=A0ABX3HIE6_PAEBO|nr:hypothetical protein BSK56_09950 [Paenibacillus borealis]